MFKIWKNPIKYWKFKKAYKALLKSNAEHYRKD